MDIFNQSFLVGLIIFKITGNTKTNYSNVHVYLYVHVFIQLRYTTKYITFMNISKYRQNSA